MVYTANSTSGVRYKVLQNIRGAIAFELTDKGDYATVVGRLDGMTLPKVIGRAFFKGNPPMEFQAAMFADGDTDREKMLSLKELTSQMNNKWNGSRPLPIPVMPESVSIENMASEYSSRTLIPVGVNCEDIRTACVDLTDNYSLVISGSVHSGKSKLLNQIANMVVSRFSNSKLYVFDGSTKSQQSLENFAHKYALVSDDVLVSEMLQEIVGFLNERKNAQNRARQLDGDSFNEKKFIENYELICIAIDDLKEFVDAVSDSNKNTMERI